MIIEEIKRSIHDAICVTRNMVRASFGSASTRDGAAALHRPPVRPCRCATRASSMAEAQPSSRAGSRSRSRLIRHAPCDEPCCAPRRRTPLADAIRRPQPVAQAAESIVPAARMQNCAARLADSGAVAIRYARILRCPRGDPARAGRELGPRLDRCACGDSGAAEEGEQPAARRRLHGYGLAGCALRACTCCCCRAIVRNARHSQHAWGCTPRLRLCVPCAHLSCACAPGTCVPCAYPVEQPSVTAAGELARLGSDCAATLLFARRRHEGAACFRNARRKEVVLPARHSGREDDPQDRRRDQPIPV
jgi:hypothetical protein